MAFTEKISISGTNLSFLFYECVNSSNGQEGFLLGDVSSEITNHISDANSDNCRLDTEISVRTFLPLPTVRQFYSPTGKINEDFIKEFLANNTHEVVGWYKYRRNNSLKPTIRDKIISRSLQKLFDRLHGNKHFINLTITNKESSSGSTHSFSYKFSKLNSSNKYEIVDDVTPNLGEILTGYKKSSKKSSGIFNRIVADTCVGNEDSNDSILRVQKAVDDELSKEAQKLVSTEAEIRIIEAEIKQMTSILAEKHSLTIMEEAERCFLKELLEQESQMIKGCKEAAGTIANADANLLNLPQELLNSSVKATPAKSNTVIKNDIRSISPHIIVHAPPRNYASALKMSAPATKEVPKPKTTITHFDDLLTFDSSEEESSNQKKLQNSPEY